MPTFTDQAGRTITLQTIPSRIVSLVPSQTELLYDLDLNEQVAGITKFCVHPPEWFYTKQRVGGTKKLHFPAIHQLSPDLIIANKDENNKEDVEALGNHYPVWTSDVNDLDQACDMIRQIGLMTCRLAKADKLIMDIKLEFLQQAISMHNTRAAYMIWNDPLMSVGADTFCNAMLQHAGFQNVFADRSRYPITTLKELLDLDCKVVLLSSEPFPFSQKHIDQMQSQAPGMKFMLVDGEMFTWYGSRLRYAPRYFMELQQKLILPL